MSHPAQHLSQNIKLQKRVYFVGTANATYYLGEAVAYNRDYGTAANVDGSRDKRVEPLSQSNNMRFAGVLDETVTLPSTGVAWVTINEPGSVCQVALGSDTVIDSTVLWAVAGTDGVGRWRDDKGAKIGRGAALALQTNTGGKIVETIDGNAATITGTAVAKTGLFAGAVAGDKLVVMACASAAGAVDGTPGVYTIASVTSNDAAVLTASGSTSAVEFAGYVISGNPTALAYLYDGEESGCIEWIECLDNAASQSMVGGFTHILGGSTLGAGDATSTLADAAFIGMRKGFLLHGALTTQDWMLTVTTSPDVATLEFDADTDEALLEWRGADGWHLLELSGAAPVVMALGSGFVGTGAVTEWVIVRTPTVIISQMFLDVTGMNSGGTAGDIIGKADQANCHFGLITKEKNGTIFGGFMRCMETPATGDDDIDVYGTVLEATGTEDAAIASLTNEVAITNAGNWAAEVEFANIANPGVGYLYLVSAIGDANATYSAGKFLLTLYGRP